MTIIVSPGNLSLGVSHKECLGYKVFPQVDVCCPWHIQYLVSKNLEFLGLNLPKAIPQP